jgi:hypothetical protein
MVQQGHWMMAGCLADRHNKILNYNNAIALPSKGD